MQREATMCHVCGKPVEQASTGRGRPREMHQCCKVIRNSLDELARHIEVVDFGDAMHARGLANELFVQYNVLHVEFRRRKREALRCVEGEVATVEVGFQS